MKIINFLIMILIFSCAEGQAAKTDNSSDTLIKKIVERFNEVENYSALVTTTAGKDKNIMRYFYRKPGYAKMVFVEPHNGATITFNPEKGKALLRPFKRVPAINLTLSPANSLITSPTGHTVDKSDMGCLLEAVIKLSEMGETTIISEGFVKNVENIQIEVKGIDDFSVNRVNRYVLNLDSKLYFPTEVTAYSSDGEIIEKMELGELAINQELPKGIFDF